MFKNYLTLLIPLFWYSCFSQETFNIDKITADPTLNPTAAVASLGEFGGASSKNYTGSLSKAISLFSLNQGIIDYSPAISYNSSGVKVNEWGGRLGIEWSENFTSVISRTVKGLPDEFVTERVSSIPTTYNAESFSYLESFYNYYEQGGGSKDGQYDIFSCNLFGENIQFIITVDQKVILLNHKQKAKIDILTTNPYTFCITLSNGYKYYFGQGSNIEFTQYSGDNPCDIDGPPFNNTATAWFLTKIVSPNSDELSFYYQNINIEYIYDYNESLTFRDRNYETDVLCPQDGFNHSAYSSRNECYRSLVSSTKYLTSVVGNDFTVSFSYVNRQDILQEKLLKKIDVYNNLGSTVKQIFFDYLQTGTVSTVPGFEGIDLRYFLSSVNVSNSSDDTQVYRFLYDNPQDLPSRFSKSQDLAGYFNNANNNGYFRSLFPEEYINSVSFVYFNSSIPTGDRSPNSNARKGLLKEITYPTGGKDSFVYELNSYTVDEEQTTYSSNINYTDVATSGYKTGYSNSITVPFSQQVTFNLAYLYQGTEELEDNAGEEYYLEYQIWNMNSNTAVTSVATILWSENPEETLDDVQTTLQPGITYAMKYKLYGIGSTIDLDYRYKTAVNNVIVEKDYYGMRIKQIITNPLEGGIPVVKKYSYKDYSETDNKLVYSNYTSANIVDLGLTGGFYSKVQEQSPCSPLNTGYRKILFYKFNSSSLYNMFAFNGSTIAYTSITEFFDENETSFIASRYNVVEQNSASPVYIYGNIYNSFPLENNAWSTGLEIKRYTGKLTGGVYKVVREENWGYDSELENVLTNFTITKSYNQMFPIDPILAHSYDAFSVTKFNTYSYRYFLNSYKAIDILDSGSELITEKSFMYNDYGMPVQEIFSGSQGQTYINKYFYPEDVISVNSLLGGALSSSQYTAINQLKSTVSNRIGEPVQIEKYLDTNNNQYAEVSEVLNVDRVNYKVWSSGLILPEAASSSKSFSDLLEIKFIIDQYDNKGKIVQYHKADGVPVTFIWGYNGQYPIAKIENATYSSVSSYVSNLQALSNADNSRTVDTVNSNGTISYVGTEGSLRQALNNLRNLSALSGAQVTTYTYDPLVGLTSITDPSGMVVYYHYDVQGRLQYFKDANGLIMEQYQYHYKDQN